MRAVSSMWNEAAAHMLSWWSGWLVQWLFLFSSIFILTKKRFLKRRQTVWSSGKKQTEKNRFTLLMFMCGQYFDFTTEEVLHLTSFFSGGVSLYSWACAGVQSWLLISSLNGQLRKNYQRHSRDCCVMTPIVSFILFSKHILLERQGHEMSEQDQGCEIQAVYSHYIL